jgi:lipoate-protein ligase A
VRVIDLGTVDGLRSQSVWHAIAACTAPGDEPTLSFVRPREPYVCLGFHRPPTEIDVTWCAEQSLPVYRRMVGGGPVYLDADQVFFQVTLPAAAVRGPRTATLRGLLAPAVRALQGLGVAARLDGYGEVCVGEAKVCGHGAGQIDNGVVVVGNLLSAFDHERAARILGPHRRTRQIVVDLMRRHICVTPVEVGVWKAAMVACYADSFGSAPTRRTLSDAEHAACERFDRKLADPRFVAGPPRPTPAVRTVKVRAGVWVHEWWVTGTVLAVAGGRVVATEGDGADGLLGAPAETARQELRARGCAALASAMDRADTEVAA